MIFSRLSRSLLSPSLAPALASWIGARNNILGVGEREASAGLRGCERTEVGLECAPPYSRPSYSA